MFQSMEHLAVFVRKVKHLEADFWGVHDFNRPVRRPETSAAQVRSTAGKVMESVWRKRVPMALVRVKAQKNFRFFVNLEILLCKTPRIPWDYSGFQCISYDIYELFSRKCPIIMVELTKLPSGYPWRAT